MQYAVVSVYTDRDRLAIIHYIGRGRIRMPYYSNFLVEYTIGLYGPTRMRLYIYTAFAFQRQEVFPFSAGGSH